MPTLLETLSEALSAHPPPLATGGTLRLHTLTSTPRSVKSLYPLAHIHPTSLDACRQQVPVSAWLEHLFVTATWTPEDSDDSVLIYALEAFLYTLPEHGSAVLYISKLDSTGWGPRSIPSSLRAALHAKVLPTGKSYGATLTANLTSAFARHFSSFRHWEADTVHHVSIHILARSQPAYLFPSSPENKNKKVLSDAGLIKWWSQVMSHTVVDTRSKDATDSRAFYLIPGYNRLESHVLLPLPPTPDQSQDLVASAGWVYGWPYSLAGSASSSPDDLPPLPLHWRNSKVARATASTAQPAVTDPHADGYDPKRVRTIPTLMPHFSDDPKTRFMDELQRDAHEHAGWKRTPAGPEGNGNGGGAQSSAQPTSEDTASLKRPPTTEGGDEDEPSKRVKVDETKPSSDTTSSTSSSSTPLTILRGQMVERRALDDLSVDEFWERMGFRQECCAGNAVGVLVCLFTRAPPVDWEPKVAVKPLPLSLPHPLIQDTVFKQLMRDVCLWNDHTEAVTLTRAWAESVDRAIRRKGGWLASAAASEDVERVGEGVIWADVSLPAPTEEQLKLAQAETVAPPVTAAPTNVLSVKRKKKA